MEQKGLRRVSQKAVEALGVLHRSTARREKSEWFAKKRTRSAMLRWGVRRGKDVAGDDGREAETSAEGRRSDGVAVVEDVAVSRGGESAIEK